MASPKVLADVAQRAEEVEPDTEGRRPGFRRVSAAAGGRDMPIDVEEYEVRATIDATFALTDGEDRRE